MNPGWKDSTAVHLVSRYCRDIWTLVPRRPSGGSVPDAVTGGRCGWFSSFMTELTDLTVVQAAVLIPTWQLALRAEDKTPATIAVYTQGVENYLSWCNVRGAAPMSRTSLNTWISEMLDAGAAPGTSRTRQLAMRRYAAWLISAGRLPADPFLGIKGPPQRHPLVTRSPTTNSVP
jgi:hypothetical protein